MSGVMKIVAAVLATACTRTYAAVPALVKKLPSTVDRACRVFCEGPLLDAVQRAGLFEDSKTFVDRPLKMEPEQVLEAFSALENRNDQNALRAFVESHFDEEGHELLPWTPTDYQEEPTQLSSIRDAEVHKWALALNRLWVTLSRVQSSAVAEAPQRHSVIKQRFPMVIPGGRFRETYYWDTYWIVRGLLVSSMVQTAQGVVENLLDYVRNFGFIPNGGRIYYLDRSQPPMLTEMVLSVYESTSNITWLKEVLPVLEEEYRFWMNPRGGHVVSVPIEANDDNVSTLNVYHSSLATPRPESYMEDVRSAQDAAKRLGRTEEDVYRGLRTAAETGWDFSSRWFSDGAPADLETVNASAIVPVDLNSIMYKVEVGLAYIHRVIAHSHGSRHSTSSANYEAAAAQRAKAMNSLLWVEPLGSYRDYRLDTRTSSKIVALSDFAAPLWAGLRGPDKAGTAAMVSSLQASGLLQAGGALTTLEKNGQQWDAPNAWAPLQLMLIEGLDGIRGKFGGAGPLADNLASIWLRTSFVAWRRTGLMYEKYDAFQPGQGGGGGEYHPQVGFGWTNGVALVLLTRDLTFTVAPLESHPPQGPPSILT